VYTLAGIVVGRRQLEMVPQFADPAGHVIADMVMLLTVLLPER
jgi:hypothetical protein